MASVRDLFNLDRPYSAEELNAHEALAKPVLLEKSKPESAEPYILRGQIYAAPATMTAQEKHYWYN